VSPRARDSYIRPPLVAIEPPSPRAVRRRFRVVLTIVLVLIAVGAFFLARALLDSGEGNPSLSSSRSANLAS
jgi:hypothetical protein